MNFCKDIFRKFKFIFIFRPVFRYDGFVEAVDLELFLQYVQFEKNKKLLCAYYETCFTTGALNGGTKATSVLRDVHGVACVTRGQSEPTYAKNPVNKLRKRELDSSCHNACIQAY